MHRLPPSPPKRFRLKDLASDILSGVLAPIYSGVGSILCFHRVLEDAARSSYGDNRALEVTPEFFEEVIHFLRAENYEFLSLDDATTRLERGHGGGRKFVCFTFDDGYWDTFGVAFPILKRHGVPFTVYLTSSYIDGQDGPWWYALEQMLEGREEISFSWDGETRSFKIANQSQREQAFGQLCRLIRNMDQTRRQDFLQKLSAATSTTLDTAGRGLMMDWEQTRSLGENELVTIGAHTISHPTLCQLPEAKAIEEIGESKRSIEGRLGRRVAHFSYPFGGRNAVRAREFALAKSCGFRSMTTTRSGNIFASHQSHLECLPRFTISGNYQTLTHVRRLLSGAASALAHPLNRVVTE